MDTCLVCQMKVIREWNLSNIKNTVSVKKSNCKEKINTLIRKL